MFVLEEKKSELQRHERIKAVYFWVLVLSSLSK